MNIMSFAGASTLPNFDLLWDYKRPAETEAKFREILPTAEQSGSLDYKLQLLTQIARTQGLQAKFVDAHLTLDNVETALNASTKIARIRYFLERGRVFNSSQQTAKALPLFEQAYTLGIEYHAENFAIDAAHMIAIAQPVLSKQIKWNKKGLATVESSKDERMRKWIGIFQNNLGWCYNDSGNFTQALVHFELALEFYEQSGQPEQTRIAKWTVARVFRSLRRIDDAIIIQLSLEEEMLPEKDGFVFEELGELYLIKNEASKARAYFAKAYPILKEIAWVEAARLERIRTLAAANAP